MLPSFSPSDVSQTPQPSAPLRQDIHAWLAKAWLDAGFEIPFMGDAWDVCPLEEADLTHQGALLAAKQLKQPPRTIAEKWVQCLSAHALVDSVSIAGPGHVNIRLTTQALLELIQEDGPFCPTPSQPPTLVEFVSANPTGPLHLGHARQAVLGSTLVNMLKHHGWVVGTEFYSNDAGNQIDMLVQSVSLRMQQQEGAMLLFERNKQHLETSVMYLWDTESGPLPSGVPEYALVERVSEALPSALWFPQGGYHGQDIKELAKKALEQGVSPSDLAGIKQLSVSQISKNQQATLKNLRVEFDSFASERALHDEKLVERVVEHLRPHCYKALQSKQEATNPKLGGKTPLSERKIALYLPSSQYGDDNDRVMLKQDGSVPYFVPDVAYHLNKFARGWERAVNIQGSDHHGTLTRLRAGVQLLGGPSNYPQTIFHTMVSVIKDGLPLVASKREGTAIPADTLIELIGVDAFRMSLLASGPESELTVDVNTWQALGFSNPVYSLQYAAARLNSLVSKSQEAPEGGIKCLEYTKQERDLAKHILVFADRLQRAALALEPARPAQFVKELAQKIHAAYEHSPKLVDLNIPSRMVHQGLFMAAHHTLVLGHNLLGLNAPERMVSLKKAPRSTP